MTNQRGPFLGSYWLRFGIIVSFIVAMKDGQYLIFGPQIPLSNFLLANAALFGITWGFVGICWLWGKAWDHFTKAEIISGKPE